MKYRPPAQIPADHVTQIMKLVANSDYGYLAGSQSLEFVASQAFKVQYYEDFPVRTVLPVDDADNDGHCWGVHLPRCRSQDMLHYMQWCDEAVSGYEVDGRGRTFWFRDPRDRTMFILRWS